MLGEPSSEKYPAITYYMLFSISPSYFLLIIIFLLLLLLSPFSFSQRLYKKSNPRSTSHGTADIKTKIIARQTYYKRTILCNEENVFKHFESNVSLQ